ncbi:DNA alkylation repair protein [Rhabdobacter roseus]|uniref:3-methyladenine DNA glycosylase AlkD n=1 Tax=Rhabdobacter roseus TaxID=1655419 RepID=A0A840TU70_9BACT|nr:DNA alkylation repair protein [Rhabdobacter roseus]MBB5284813.1 3-methyladenine DNA glycosylase AlkD [Rhabdobacter roseus]
MDLVQGVRSELAARANPERAAFMSRYFQTGPGQYAEGDIFWGISNPQARDVARRWRLALAHPAEVLPLLQDPVHECRLVALLLWVAYYPKAPKMHQEVLYELYLTHRAYINNWDLVDLSARDIVGYHLWEKDRSVLMELSQSTHLWTQRIALLATFYFIREGQFEDTIRVAEVLLTSKHPLIHKAIGWMLREIGKRDLDTLEAFLHQHSGVLARTSLHYAIERLPPARRQYYLTL